MTRPSWLNAPAWAVVLACIAMVGFGWATDFSILPRTLISLTVGVLALAIFGTISKFDRSRRDSSKQL